MLKLSTKSGMALAVSATVPSPMRTTCTAVTICRGTAGAKLGANDGDAPADGDGATMAGGVGVGVALALAPTESAAVRVGVGVGVGVGVAAGRSAKTARNMVLAGAVASTAHTAAPVSYRYSRLPAAS